MAQWLGSTPADLSCIPGIHEWERVHWLATLYSDCLGIAHSHVYEHTQYPNSSYTFLKCSKFFKGKLACSGTCGFTGDTPTCVQSRKTAGFSYKKAPLKVKVAQGSCLWEPQKPDWQQQRKVCDSWSEASDHSTGHQYTRAMLALMYFILKAAIAELCKAHLAVSHICLSWRFQLNLFPLLNLTGQFNSLKTFCLVNKQHDCVVRTARELPKDKR